MSRALAVVWMIVSLANMVIDHASADEGVTNSKATQQVQPRHHDNLNRLEDRVKLLTASLNLDARQQAQVKAILERQREQMQAVRNDTAIPPARRVAATQAISDHTSDAIRVILSDEQKKKFGAPKPTRDPLAGSDKRSVEDWMNAGNKP